MTRDDIIRMAREAGFSAYHLAVLDQGIYRLADLVAAAERESCAKVAEEWQLGIDDPKYQTDCAFAIRERGAP